MAPQRKRLGVGARCIVPLQYLHPKDKVKERIPNQMSSQQLNGSIVQVKEERPICREPKMCIVFRHEDFGGQPLWSLQQYIKIEEEGPSESFFEALEPPDGGVAGVPAAATTNNNANIPNNPTNNNDAEEVELPATIQRFINDPVNMLDEEDIQLATSAAPMVNDDNAPPPENVPQSNDSAVAIMIGWQHSGVCFRRCNVRQDVKPELPAFHHTAAGDITNLQIFEVLFFPHFIREVIIPATNKKLEEDQEKLTYGEFLHWLGLWLLMATIIGPQRHEFWSSSEINEFSGAPLRLGVDVQTPLQRNPVGLTIHGLRTSSIC